MTEPTALALLRDAEAYLSALHVHVARHDSIGADLACGGCRLRDRIAAALPALAQPAVVPVPPPADRAALRDRIAAAIRDAACPGNCGKTEEECARERIQPLVWHHGRLAVVESSPEMFADVVLAVLPEPADRAAVLREAADRIDATREPFPIAVQNGITWATAELRRMAAEAQPVCVECGHPQAVHREGDDPVTPGTCSACSEDDDRHDYVPAAGVRQGGVQSP